MTDAPVALDAHGGDHAPQVALRAAALAAARGTQVALVGDPERLAAVGAEPGSLPGGVRLVPAAGAVGMGDDPVAALRATPDASVRRACRMVADGEAAAAVSAGSTGATLGAAVLELGRLPGVRRPAAAATLPTRRAGTVVLIDAGATADADARMLAGYARLGRALRVARGEPADRVGLLNVGAEPGKGPSAVREAFAELDGRRWFVGNVEPDAVLAGEVDVVVADGFAGNVLLKTLEAARGMGTAAGSGQAAGGGAPLVGVDGTVLVAHGGVGAEGLASALDQAAGLARDRLPARLRASLDDDAAPGAGRGSR